MIPSASRRAGDRAGSWTVGPAGTRRWLQGLGAVIDPVDAYAWGWEELRRIEAEMAREADRVRPGASVDEAISLLDETQYVVGADPYRAWLQKRHDWAVEQLHGTHFDIAEPLRTVEVTLARGSTSGAAYYTPPSEDLTRPGVPGGRSANGLGWRPATRRDGVPASISSAGTPPPSTSAPSAWTAWPSPCAASTDLRGQAGT